MVSGLPPYHPAKPKLQFGRSSSALVDERESPVVFRAYSFCLILALLAFQLPVMADDTAHAEREKQFKTDIQPLLKKLCYDCHGATTSEADLSLEKFESAQSILEGRKTWLKSIERVEKKEMPPKEGEQPSDAERAKLTEFLKNAVNAIDCGKTADPGRVTIRRLNRFEYQNTIRDWIGLTYKPAADFPGDDVGYGFDNIGDVMSLPPILMEKYMTAAELIAKKAIVTEGLDPPVKMELLATTFQKPAGAADQEGGIVTLATDGTLKHEIELPSEGTYEISVIAAQTQGGNESAKMKVSLPGIGEKEFQVRAARNKTGEFKQELKTKGGKQTVEISFLNDFYDPNAKDERKRDRNLIVHRLKVSGPKEFKATTIPETHKKLVIVRPSKDLNDYEAAKQVCTSLVRNAFRRPPRGDEVDRLIRIVQLAQDQGENFETGVQYALQAVLISPHFLFRMELDPAPGEVRSLSDHELAVRLAYFLWSTAPDAELSKLADEGKLHDKEILRGQVKRMLSDDKSHAVVDNFAAQWLQLRLLSRMKPDQKAYPQFSDALLADMRRETEMLFEFVMSENRPVLELLTADYTFVNDRLADLYGIENIKGDQFRKISLADSPRRGILMQSSILTVTSNPTRTSPVKRGRWVLDNLLNMPPPPAPPDVPLLDDDNGKQLTGTLRQRMEQHRSNPTCATCHQKMDPLGFALENFDGIGKWRKQDGGADIDASGDLPSGEKFSGARELIDLLVKSKKEEFHRCVSEKLLTYALGRGLEYYDQCAIDAIMKQMTADEGRFHTLVYAIVESEPFQKRASNKKENQ